MLSSNMLPIIFRLINFALFIGLLIYGFKRYVYDALLAQMIKQENNRKGLEEKKELLAILQARLDEQIYGNEREYKELIGTLHTWRHNFEHKQRELEEEKARIKYQLELKMARRREIQALNLVQDELITPVIQENQKALHDYFAHQKHGKAYLKELIAYMENRQP